MRKFIFFTILVIILVCLNWFTELTAQDLSALTASQKARLMQLSDVKSPASPDPSHYQTPLIFDSTDMVLQPELTPDRNVQNVDESVLVPFGTELFAGPREVNPPNDIASADDYVLGPGDNLIVNLWGRVDKDYSLTVDREGKIFVPQVGDLVVWGKTLAEFKQQLQGKLSRVYSDFQLNVSLGKIRSIRIYLTGEVKRPGAYTVSSLTSLFNALYLAGGPSKTGSMRQIRLMRNGQAISEVDIYKFLLEGDNSSDIRLESGDAIFIPVAGSRVSISGLVHRPAIYELINDETALDVLALAGNATPEAYLDRVMLERISDSDQWEVLDLNLNAAAPDSVDNIVLTDGDRLTVFSMFTMKRNMVAAFGLVQHPGYYERNDSTRLSNLLERAKLQPYDVFYRRANLFRRYSDWRTEVIAVDLEAVLKGAPEKDILLNDHDSLHIYSIGDVAWKKSVYIGGAVQKPGSCRLFDRMTVEDLIFLAGSFTREACQYRAELARYDSLGQVHLQVIDLGDRDAVKMRLCEDDRLYVRRIPQWSLHRTVTIDGEIQFPGEYVLREPEETLYSLVQRAGGFARDAFHKGLVFERSSIGKALERQQVPDLLRKSNPLVKDSTGKIRRSMLFDYDAKDVNRIVIDMDHLIESNGKHGNITLRPGDKIYVPATPTGISVLGAVCSNGTIKFRENQKVKYYVKRAGGFSGQADKKGIRLIKASGEAMSGGGTMGKRVDLGDVIMVPTRIHEKRDWTKTLTTVLTTTTGVLTTILLIDRL